MKKIFTELWQDFRMYICELLLNLILYILPGNTADGSMMISMIYKYFEHFAVPDSNVPDTIVNDRTPGKIRENCKRCGDPLMQVFYQFGEEGDKWCLGCGNATLNPWRDMETAPKDGSHIEVHDGDVSKPYYAFWSERPVCMGGPTVYIKPGWATCGPDVDTNLPLDPPAQWRKIQ